MLKPSDIEKTLNKRFPEAVSLIVSRSKTGKINVCPVGFFALASHNPKVWAISVYEEHSTNKFIKETEEFVLCLPSLKQIDDLMTAGSVHFGKDKMKKVGFKFAEVNGSGVPVIGDSTACFVCKVIKKLNVGDHTTFFGEIISAYDSDMNWQSKIYNLDNRKLGNIKYGDSFKLMNFSPEGAVKSK